MQPCTRRRNNSINKIPKSYFNFALEPIADIQLKKSVTVIIFDVHYAKQNGAGHVTLSKEVTLDIAMIKRTTPTSHLMKIGIVPETARVQSVRIERSTADDHQQTLA